MIDDWHANRYFTFCLGFPMTAGKTDLGQSSPAIPVLQRPEPLSMTTAGFVTFGLDIMRSVKNNRELRDES